MSERDQVEELRRLREQVAELTRRVYRLEGLVDHSSDAAVATALPATPTTYTSGEHEANPKAVLPLSKPLIVESVISPAPAPPSKGVEPVLSGVATKPSRPTRDGSLESRIGGQWLNRVGIVAVLVGLSYFLKLAFENNWIGPTTQVLIGIAAGLGILLWSERFRHQGYSGFGYSLKALAVGALYLSLWAASQYYHLVPPTVSFFGMVMVTLTSAALSLRQDAELLAAFALVGGFLTPVLISTGENHEIALFCYLALLDLGTAWIVAIKKWRRILLGSFVGTVLLFATWASGYYTEPQLTITFAFATFFFLLYAAAPFYCAQSTTLPAAQAVMIALAVLNATFYFVTSYLILNQHHRFELSWLSVAAAVFYFLLARALGKRNVVAGSVYGPLHLALGIGFLTAAIPLKVGGNWITLGWLVEAGALFWAAHRGHSLLLRWLGVVALILGVMRLLLLDSGTTQTTLLVNPRFGLYLAAIAALALLAYFTLSERGMDNHVWVGAAALALNILALLALHFEVIDYFQPPSTQMLSPATLRSLHTLRDFTYSAVWMIYGSGLMLVGFLKRSAFLRWQAIVLLVLTAGKVFFYDISALERGYRIAAFIVLGIILLAVSFFYQRSRIKSAV